MNHLSCGPGTETINLITNVAPIKIVPHVQRLLSHVTGARKTISVMQWVAGTDAQLELAVPNLLMTQLIIHVIRIKIAPNVPSRRHSAITALLTTSVMPSEAFTDVHTVSTVIQMIVVRGKNQNTYHQVYLRKLALFHLFLL